MTVRLHTAIGTLAASVLLVTGLASAPLASATQVTVTPASSQSLRPSAEVQDWRVRMLDLVNAQRAKVGVAPLILCAALNRASAKYAKQMSQTGHFDHIAPDGTDPADRGTAEGYQIQSYGENIAAGQKSVRRVMNGWVHSPGHYANIISDHFTHLGVGHAFSKKTRYSEYWVQNFGAGGPC